MNIKQWPKGVWALLIMGVLALFLLPLIQPGKADDSKDNRNKEDGAIPVHAKVINGQELANIFTTTGSIIPAKEVSLKTQTSGRVTDLPLKEGERVKKGELLLAINNAELQAQLKQARHQQTLLQKQLERKKQLLAEKGISQESYDKTKTELASTKAEIDKIEAQIAKTKIKAPFSGKLGLKQVSVGAYLSPATEVINLVQQSPVKIDFSVPGKYADYIQKGEDIQFTIGEIDTPLTASIYAIEPTISESTRTLQVRAIYPNEDQAITPGSFADIKLTLANKQKALMVPSIAIIPELQGKQVFVYKNGQSYPQKVETGQRTNDEVQVQEGLSVGDTVITKGVQKLRAGKPVRIQSLSNVE